jgi:hypothetical protein
MYLSASAFCVSRPRCRRGMQLWCQFCLFLLILEKREVQSCERRRRALCHETRSVKIGLWAGPEPPNRTGATNCHRLVDYLRDRIGPACGGGEVRHSGGSPEQPEHWRYPNCASEAWQPMSNHALISMMARSPSRSNRRPDYARRCRKRAASHVLVANATIAAFASASASLRRLAAENGNATCPNQFS